jgi:hypothetical protein
MKRLSSALLVCVLLLATTRLIAQSTNTAAIRGSVTDPTGAAVPGALITLQNPDTGAHRQTRSDARGEYAFAALPITGTYVLRVTGEGLAEVTNGPFTLRAGETAAIRTLVTAQAVSENVTVYGTVEGVRSDSPELATRLDERALRTIPVFGRKLTTLPLLNSAVRPARGTGDLFLNNTLFVVNGSGRRQTTFRLDGSSGDDAWGRQTRCRRSASSTC